MILRQRLSLTLSCLAVCACVEPTRVGPALSLTVSDTAILIQDTVRVGIAPIELIRHLNPNAVTWGSSDSDVAQIDHSGLITGVGAGDASISATYAGQTSTISIRVAAILIGKRHPRVIEAESLVLTAATAPGLDHSATIAWESSRPDIARIDSNGIVTAIQPGVTQVSATIGSYTDVVLLSVVPAVLVGAGDIADCLVSGDEATAALLDSVDGIVITFGDNAYPSGRAEDFANCYEPGWGRHKARTRPSPGNHEYETPGAWPYFAYFGEAAGEPGKGYYSYNYGAWHVVALNSFLPSAAGSPQERWLRADLAANPRRCTLVYMHYPLFSSGRYAVPGMRPLWRTMYELGVDLLLVGHDHIYERFAPQDPDGNADPVNGIRQIIVGTGGGRSHHPIVVAGGVANSEIRDDRTWGVIKVTLRPDHYEWTFIPESGRTFTDSGSAMCN